MHQLTAVQGAKSRERGADAVRTQKEENKVITLAEIFDFDDGGHGGGRRPQWAVLSVQFSAAKGEENLNRNEVEIAGRQTGRLGDQQTKRLQTKRRGDSRVERTGDGPKANVVTESHA